MKGRFSNIQNQCRLETNASQCMLVVECMAAGRKCSCGVREKREAVCFVGCDISNFFLPPVFVYRRYVPLTVHVPLTHGSARCTRDIVIFGD